MTEAKTTPTNEAGHGLPELPEPDPDMQGKEYSAGCYESGYTADQMRRYARDALALSRGVPEGCIAELKKARDGWEGEAQRIRISRDYWRMRCQMIEEYRDRENGRGVWFWQGDGADYPDSMAKDMTVVIRADELRELIKAAPAAAGAQGEDAKLFNAGWMDGNDKGWSSGYQRGLYDSAGMPRDFDWNEAKAKAYEAYYTTTMPQQSVATPQPAADGGVRERARELLAAELDAIRFPAMAAEIRDESGYNTLGAAMVRVVTRALEQAMTQQPALSSHRQAGDESLYELHSRFLSDTSRLPEEWQDWRNDFARDIRALVEKGAGNA